MVVGESSGLGRCIPVGLARRGADVALLARRRERLAVAAREAGPWALAIECDVTDESSSRPAIDAAASGLGGIDAPLSAPAIGPLAHLVDADAETWRRVFDTNVTGATRITAAAVPHLAATSGFVAYSSSVSASRTASLARPRRVLCQQGCPGQARRGLASGAARHRPYEVLVDSAGGEGGSRTEFTGGGTVRWPRSSG